MSMRLGLATPMSIMVATGRAPWPASSSKTPRRSRSWKGSTRSSWTRRARSPKAARLVSLVTAPGQTESDLLRLAATLERDSEHRSRLPSWLGGGKEAALSAVKTSVDHGQRRGGRVEGRTSAPGITG